MSKNTIYTKVKKKIFINMSWWEDINSNNVFRIPTVMFFSVQRIQFQHLLLWNLEWENVYVLLNMLRVARLWKDTCQVKKLKYTNYERYERRIQYNIIEFQGIKNLCYKHMRPMGHIAHLTQCPAMTIWIALMLYIYTWSYSSNHIQLHLIDIFTCFLIKFKVVLLIVNF